MKPTKRIVIMIALFIAAVGIGYVGINQAVAGDECIDCSCDPCECGENGADCKCVGDCTCDTEMNCKTADNCATAESCGAAKTSKCASACGR